MLDNRLNNIMKTPGYELLQNFLSMFNLLFVAANDFMATKPEIYIKYWMCTMICINNFFLFELIVDLVFFGIINAFKHHLRVWFETVCQIVNIYGMIHFFQDIDNVLTYNSYEKIFTFIIFIRALKMLTLMYEIKSLRIIVETMKNLVQPISNLSLVLLVVYWIFAILGMRLFGGKIRKDLDYPI